MTRETLEKHMNRLLHYEHDRRYHAEWKARIDLAYWLDANGLYRRNDNRTFDYAHSYARALRRLGY